MTMISVYEEPMPTHGQGSIAPMNMSHCLPVGSWAAVSATRRGYCCAIVLRRLLYARLSR
jgi:hypothetical protein